MLNFYKGKTILITGHTGFKGSWLSKILIDSGAQVIGYSLKPTTNPSLFNILKIKNQMKSIIGDIRDYNKLYKTIKLYKPDIIFHLAAQPLVKYSYINPRYTYDTNVMGTVNILECIRNTNCVKSFINVTTDKVYYNEEKPNKKFKEGDRLDGFDPYSNSKSCSELVTAAYRRSFANIIGCTISTVRAGNVIGGGDFSDNRIIPDCFRAIKNNKNIIIRNPNSIRPYQHVLEALNVYLMVAKLQYNNKSFANSYNVGPNIKDCIRTEKLASLFLSGWNKKIKIKYSLNNGPHEATFLKLSNNKIKKILNWKPYWNINKSIEFTKRWYQVYLYNNKNIIDETEKQIELYFKNKKNTK